jgi:hypothetical protein
MSKLLDKLTGERACLLVSIPTNSVEPALAAEAGGADGLKVHINVTHHATGIQFGTFQEEAENIKKVIESVSIPVGLVPGESLSLSLDTLQKAAELGISFVDSYCQFWPASIHTVGGVDLWAAFDSTYSFDEMRTIANFPWVDAVEASIVPVSQYGANLSWRDLGLYFQLKGAINKPLIIPSQCKIRPDDIPALKNLGLKNYLMGAIALGREPEQIERMTREFRQALEA